MGVVQVSLQRAAGVEVRHEVEPVPRLEGVPQADDEGVPEGREGLSFRARVLGLPRRTDDLLVQDLDGKRPPALLAGPLQRQEDAAEGPLPDHVRHREVADHRLDLAPLRRPGRGAPTGASRVLLLLGFVGGIPLVVVVVVVVVARSTSPVGGRRRRRGGGPAARPPAPPPGARRASEFDGAGVVVVDRPAARRRAHGLVVGGPVVRRGRARRGGFDVVVDRRAASPARAARPAVRPALARRERGVSEVLLSFGAHGELEHVLPPAVLRVEEGEGAVLGEGRLGVGADGSLRVLVLVLVARVRRVVQKEDGVAVDALAEFFVDGLGLAALLRRGRRRRAGGRRRDDAVVVPTFSSGSAGAAAAGTGLRGPLAARGEDVPGLAPREGLGGHGEVAVLAAVGALRSRRAGGVGSAASADGAGGRDGRVAVFRGGGAAGPLLGAGAAAAAAAEDAGGEPGRDEAEEDRDGHEGGEERERREELRSAVPAAAAAASRRASSGGGFQDVRGGRRREARGRRRRDGARGRGRRFEGGLRRRDFRRRRGRREGRRPSRRCGRRRQGRLRRGRRRGILGDRRRGTRRRREADVVQSDVGDFRGPADRQELEAPRSRRDDRGPAEPVGSLVAVDGPELHLIELVAAEAALQPAGLREGGVDVAAVDAGLLVRRRAEAALEAVGFVQVEAAPGQEGQILRVDAVERILEGQRQDARPGPEVSASRAARRIVGRQERKLLQGVRVPRQGGIDPAVRRLRVGPPLPPGGHSRIRPRGQLVDGVAADTRPATVKAFRALPPEVRIEELAPRPVDVRRLEVLVEHPLLLRRPAGLRRTRRRPPRRLGRRPRRRHSRRPRRRTQRRQRRRRTLRRHTARTQRRRLRRRLDSRVTRRRPRRRRQHTRRQDRRKRRRHRARHDRLALGDLPQQRRRQHDEDPRRPHHRSGESTCSYRLITIVCSLDKNLFRW
mmetsp:Transcript_12385/g.40471  ORF Transcript_12385/g.40471 Transcript_12385/m.40471 type:complete len:955 (-) Transcript_12385:74-2938(-)